jgi:hypothetical protein
MAKIRKFHLMFKPQSTHWTEENSFLQAEYIRYRTNLRKMQCFFYQYNLISIIGGTPWAPTYAIQNWHRENCLIACVFVEYLHKSITDMIRIDNRLIMELIAEFIGTLFLVVSFPLCYCTFPLFFFNSICKKLKEPYKL